MKLRIIKLTPDQLVLLLQGKGSALSLPADLELLDAKVNLFSRRVLLVVRSDSFEDVSDSAEIPELQTAIIASPPVEETKPVPVAPAPSAPVALKAEPKPEVTNLTPEPKILIPRPTHPPISRYAAKMENEFSPDQRKLLSFSVKDDVVVVKPVTFLKVEWNDINDVVRGLGGRWVKGDIISYWEIPLQ